MTVNKLTFTQWNETKKPDICDCVASENDICYKVGNYCLCCETYKGLNNLVCFIVDETKADYRECMKAMFYFCYILATKHNVKYAKVKGRKGKYEFLKRMFLGDVFCEKNLIDNEQVFYVRFSDNTIQKLKELSE